MTLPCKGCEAWLPFDKDGMHMESFRGQEGQFFVLTECTKERTVTETKSGTPRIPSPNLSWHDQHCELQPSTRLIDEFCCCFERGQIKSLSDDLSRIKTKISERNKTDPVTRLHNLCDGLEEEKASSVYGTEAWQMVDEENERLRKELKQSQESLRKALAREEWIYDWVFHNGGGISKEEIESHMPEDLKP